MSERDNGYETLDEALLVVNPFERARREFDSVARKIVGRPEVQPFKNEEGQHLGIFIESGDDLKRAVIATFPLKEDGFLAENVVVKAYALLKKGEDTLKKSFQSGEAVNPLEDRISFRINIFSAALKIMLTDESKLTEKIVPQQK